LIFIDFHRFPGLAWLAGLLGLACLADLAGLAWLGWLGWLGQLLSKKASKIIVKHNENEKSITKTMKQHRKIDF